MYMCPWQVPGTTSCKIPALLECCASFSSHSLCALSFDGCRCKLLSDGLNAKAFGAPAQQRFFLIDAQCASDTTPKMS